MLAIEMSMSKELCEFLGGCLWRNEQCVTEYYKSLPQCPSANVVSPEGEEPREYLSFSGSQGIVVAESVKALGMNADKSFSYFLNVRSGGKEGVSLILSTSVTDEAELDVLAEGDMFGKLDAQDEEEYHSPFYRNDVLRRQLLVYMSRSGASCTLVAKLGTCTEVKSRPYDCSSRLAISVQYDALKKVFLLRTPDAEYPALCSVAGTSSGKSDRLVLGANYVLSVFSLDRTNEKFKNVYSATPNRNDKRLADFDFFFCKAPFHLTSSGPDRYICVLPVLYDFVLMTTSVEIDSFVVYPSSVSRGMFDAYSSSTNHKFSFAGFAVTYNQVRVIRTKVLSAAGASNAFCNDYSVNSPLSLSTWSIPQEDGASQYRLGWANELSPLTNYVIKVSHPSKQSGKELWFPVKTSCGCTISNPSGAPSQFKVHQTTTHVAFSWVDQSGCEDGFVFYRQMSDDTSLVGKWRCPRVEHK